MSKALRKQAYSFGSSNSMCDLGDEIIDGLLLCTQRPWFITCFSLWVSGLYDSLLYFIQNTDALSRHLTILKSIVGWVHGWDLAGFVSEPGAALLASCPLGHDATFLKNTK